MRQKTGSNTRCSGEVVGIGARIPPTPPFRFLLARVGAEGWRRYLEDLGRDYFAPVNRQWAAGGLPARTLIHADLAAAVKSIVS